MKRWVPLLAAAFLAAVAGVLVYVSLQAVSPKACVVVAKTNLSVGDVIGEEDVAVRRLPSAAVPRGAFRSEDGVVGKTVVAGPVLAGDVVRGAHVCEEGSLSAALRTFAPEGWVGTELPDGVGLGMTGIRRGDIVDVYVEAEEGGAAVLVEGAVVISTPWTTVGGRERGSGVYVVAVPPEYAPGVAEAVVVKSAVTVVLKSSGGKEVVRGGAGAES